MFLPARAISTCHSSPNLTPLTTGQWTSPPPSTFALPRLLRSPIRFARRRRRSPGVFTLCLPSLWTDPSPLVVGSQVEREQIRYPLTSSGEFEVLIAVNPTAVCSPGTTNTRFIRARALQQGGLSRGTPGRFPVRSKRESCARERGEMRTGGRIISW